MQQLHQEGTKVCVCSSFNENESDMIIYLSATDVILIHWLIYIEVRPNELRRSDRRIYSNLHNIFSRK